MIKKQVIYIASNALVLASGILMIVIPAVIFNNYWPLLSILVFCISLVFPFLCGAFEIGASNSWGGDEGTQELGPMLSWVILGVFVTIGYAVPFELWRSDSVNAIGMGLTMGGGTVIMVAILVFTQLQWKRETDGLDY